MKKYVTAALFIFWVVVTGLFVAALLFYQQQKKPAGSMANPAGNGVVLNKSQLAAHNTAGSCWLLISGKIYDVSNYLTAHPGGADTIIQHCGTDSTEAFATRGGGQRDHSAYAYDMLANYYIGDFGQALAQATAPIATTSLIGTAEVAANPDAPAPATVKPVSINLSAAEVAKHNNLSNCWLLISGKVYDVTSYMNNHPGGVGTITPYCGADGTTAFDTRGGSGSHSSYAYGLLANYYVGDLGQAVSQTQTQTAPVTNQNSTTSGNRRHDDEEDDD
jgi:cytochrome b involved in lipid metabolism